MKLPWILPLLLLPLLAGASAAADEEWGESANGLSCRLVIPLTELPVGARPEFTLLLRYDGPEEFFVRDRHLEAGRVRLSFRNVETGKVHQRTPDDGSLCMPSLRRLADFEFLAPGFVGTLTLPLRLLTKEGVQLPPGFYDVTAAYTSRADADTEQVEVPGKLRAVRIVSPPVRLTVVPAEPAEDTFHVPSRITFKRSEHGLSYGCAREDVASVRVVVRPGYFVTMQTRYLVSIGGGDYEETGQSIGWCFGAWSFLHGKRAETVLLGESFAVRMVMEVVETPWPQDWHGAYPTNGKSLWKGEIAGVMPDSVR